MRLEKCVGTQHQLSDLVQGLTGQGKLQHLTRKGIKLIYSLSHCQVVGVALLCKTCTVQCPTGIWTEHKNSPVTCLVELSLHLFSPSLLVRKPMDALFLVTHQLAACK